MAALRQAITDGWADVAGGTYSEAEDPLLPLESILWQFRRGTRSIAPTSTIAASRPTPAGGSACYSQLPQIAKRFGFRYALHMGFDAGRFPIRPETKRLWESPDGSSLESLLRPPLAADRPSQGWLSLADGGDDEGRPRRRAPAGPLAQPGRAVVSRPPPGRGLFARAGALDDAQRLLPPDRPALRDHSAPSPITTNRPTWRRPSPGARPSRSRGWPATIGCGPGWRRRGRSQALARAIASSAAGGLDRTPTLPDLPALEEIESLIETGRHDEAATALDRVEPAWSAGAGAADRRHVGRGRIGQRPPPRLPGDQPARTCPGEPR